jgi:hypothetical protein
MKMSCQRRGILMVTLLMLLMVILMWSAALFSLNRGELVNGSHYRDRVKALQLARGGLNHATQVLTLEPSSTTTILWSEGDSGYEILFSGAAETRSVNNLSSLAPSTTLNFRGDAVPGHTADLLVSAWCGQRRVKVRGVLRRGFLLDASVNSTDKVVLDGDIFLDGIRSLDDRTPIGGGVVSVYRSAGPTDHAVNWLDTGSSTFAMNGEAQIQSGPEADTSYDSVSGNLKALYPDRIDEGAANQPPPRFSVPDAVSSGSSHPIPDGAALVGGTYRLGYSHIADNRYLNGDLEVTGDLSLSGGTLYVQGDLVLNGGVHGIGSVFVDGDISINGGNSVVLTNQSSGAALFSSQDVTLTGIDASGYLDSLASWYPPVDLAKSDFSTAYDAFSTVANRTPSGPEAETLWAHTQALSWEQSNETNYWLNPIAGPNGTFTSASAHRPIPKLILAIKNSLGPGYHTDVRAQKIVRALEQTHHNFRFNYINAASDVDIDLDTYTISGVSPAAHYAGLLWGWDDDVYLANPPADPLMGWSLGETIANGARFKDLSIDHKYRATGGNTTGLPPHLQALRAQMFAQTKAFTDMHPLDFGWLGDSYFQGLVYAEGEVNVDNRFRVIGSLISHDRVQLSGGSSLIYNDEYRTYEGASGPISVTVYEEL